MHSSLYSGWVRHRRTGPVPHEFRYRLFMVYADLAELPGLFDRRWFWSARRPAIAWFRRADYLGDPQQPLDAAVRDRVVQATGHRPAGPIRLLTHLRYFGHNFNPVSFYYCFDADDTRVETIVAEITNTPWGERHAYVLPVPADAGTRTMRFRFDKDFHVSPFLPMDMQYEWRFSPPGKQLVVHMRNFHGNQPAFDATLVLGREEISGPRLARALAAFPLVTLKVSAAIYWQALRLWLKKTPVHLHPAKLVTRS